MKLLYYISKSKFIKSIFIRIIAVFLVVILTLTIGVSYFFSSQIQTNLIQDKQHKLDMVESTISSRMEEVISIAYNIGDDSTFLLEPVDDDRYSSKEMCDTLSHYLTGNKFIKYLGFYRVSEPNTLYTSNGEMTFHHFWDAYIDCDSMTEEEYMNSIINNTGVNLIQVSSSTNGNAFCTYVCPLPQFSMNPRAYAIVVFPLSEISDVMDSMLEDGSGEITIYDASGEIIYTATNINTELDVNVTGENEYYIKTDGKKFVVQEKTSEVNRWSFVSAARVDNVSSSLVKNQVITISVLVILMICAVLIIIYTIVVKYKPIIELTDMVNNSKDRKNSVDENSLLSDTFITLKDDSDQKQRYKEAYMEADAASKAKSAFLSSMSHDIRTPMNAIIGMTGIAQKHLDDPVYVKDCLQKVDVASQYLLDIINNVLDMSRIESGKITLSNDTIELSKLIYEILTIMNTNIRMKNLKLVAKARGVRQEKITGDKIRLTQVCMNILSNAVKFTPENGTISIEISQEESNVPGCGKYIFTFADNGIGMSEEFIEKVYDTFSRATESGVSKIEGTGLGMAIAKNIVGLMGGTIDCKSKLGKGTTFTVTIDMPFAKDNLTDEMFKPYHDTSIMIIGDDEETAMDQMAIFDELSIKASYVKDVDSIKDEEEFEYVIINASDGATAIEVIEKCVSLPKVKAATCILALKDMSDVDRSAVIDLGVKELVMIPFFRSTIMHLFSTAETLTSYTKKTKSEEVDFTGLHVLLVEDNNMNRLIASHVIKETKAEVIEAVDGREAVDRFNEKPEGYFDIILMDIQMPVMNGFEATAEIRALNRDDAKSVFICAMTANTFDEDVRQVLDAGMNCHLGKPYSPDKLIEILERVYC